MNEFKSLIIKELNIEVETELREKIKFKDIKIPKDWRLLTFQECCYIYDNLHDKIKIGKDTEWIEHYSEKMKKKGYASALSSLWSDGGLNVDGYYLDAYGDGYAFGVRFCKDLKEGEGK